jgi:hypothetical protein
MPETLSHLCTPCHRFSIQVHPSDSFNLYCHSMADSISTLPAPMGFTASRQARNATPNPILKCVSQGHFPSCLLSELRCWGFWETEQNQAEGKWLCDSGYSGPGWHCREHWSARGPSELSQMEESWDNPTKKALFVEEPLFLDRKLPRAWSNMEMRQAGETGSQAHEMLPCTWFKPFSVEETSKRKTIKAYPQPQIGTAVVTFPRLLGHSPFSFFNGIVINLLSPTLSDLSNLQLQNLWHYCPVRNWAQRGQ